MTSLLAGISLGTFTAGAAIACMDEQLGAALMLIAAAAGFASAITNRGRA